VKQDELDSDLEFTMTIGLGGKSIVIEKQTENNLENGKEYVGVIETPYWNLLLDKRVLIIQEKLAKHRSFLPQEVVQCEVWIRGF
jgi:hypothetical protein